MQREIRSLRRRYSQIDWKGLDRRQVMAFYEQQGRPLVDRVLLVAPIYPACRVVYMRQCLLDVGSISVWLRERTSATCRAI